MGAEFGMKKKLGRAGIQETEVGLWQGRLVAGKVVEIMREKILMKQKKCLPWKENL
jgi:hypothetical protein